MLVPSLKLCQKNNNNKQHVSLVNSKLLADEYIARERSTESPMGRKCINRACKIPAFASSLEGRVQEK